MARTLPTPCTQQGCPELVAGGGRCAKHRDPRPVADTAWVYNTQRWRRLRVWVIANEPCCRECAREGRTTLATSIDHILPMDQGGAVWDERNLQPLCDTCHSRKTLRENRSQRW